ncbi:hypothetical protein ARMA_2430 [Ardenticatena maritima]|uniref:Uncharacterized protein n=1 Tax=Ardenticatena maritima TaxID=872965 RepID=A0A0M9UDJ1_9CHLR|nr:hypothetical protein ARMA_2430 [Ardenticatena maritima]
MDVLPPPNLRLKSPNPRKGIETQEKMTGALTPVFSCLSAFCASVQPLWTPRHTLSREGGNERRESTR